MQDVKPLISFSLGTLIVVCMIFRLLASVAKESKSMRLVSVSNGQEKNYGPGAFCQSR